MPIYTYRCASCGFERDHLQKLSDPALRICPECGQTTYSKQVTAAGFQLKGNGWYATDFKGGNNKVPVSTEKPKSAENSESAENKGSSKEGAPSPACATGANACAGN
jgi:putative FmdB family regulatory protein